MTKSEFLMNLRQELSFLPEEELNDAIRYYDEYISEAGQDEEKIIADMGTARKVAEDFKNEYYDKRKTNADSEIAKVNNTKRGMRPWVVVLICILSIGFGIPIIEYTRSFLPGMAGACLIVILILIIFKVLSDRQNRNTNRANTRIQTCSDIKDINLELKAGNFQLKTGDGFSVDTAMSRSVSVHSYISNNTWFVRSDVNIGNGIDDIIQLTIPKEFHAEDARIRLAAGNILVSGLSSDNTVISVDAGKCEIKDMYSRNLNVKVGMGDMTSSCYMNGDVCINCGMGKVDLNLKNRSDEFNCEAKVDMGSIQIGDQKIQGIGGNISKKIGAMNNINVRCGMGNVNVTFGEQI